LVESSLQNRNTLSPFVRNSEGQKAQKKLWTELADKLNGIEPGVIARAGL